MPDSDLISDRNKSGTAVVKIVLNELVNKSGLVLRDLVNKICFHNIRLLPKMRELLGLGLLLSS